MGDTLLIGLMLATLAVLIVGVAMMAIGGKKNKKYNTKMMTLRVALQGAALVAFVALYLTK